MMMFFVLKSSDDGDYDEACAMLVLMTLVDVSSCMMCVVLICDKCVVYDVFCGVMYDV